MNYKQKILSFLLVILFSTFNLAYAKPKEVDPKSYLKAGNGANTLYIENKGQIGDQDGKPNPSVKYLILRPGLNIQLKANSFSYDAYTIERFKRVIQLPEPVHHKFDKQNDDSLVYHFSRVDIELVNANPNPLITHEGVSSDYLNYYTHITSQTNGEDGATGVRGYSSITYHDIYPNIDLEWFLDNNGKPEYQFIINPGGDPSRIRLKYHGAKKTELISDAIHIHIKPGIIKEHIPISYLKESKEKVQISFIKLSNNEYGFEYPKYASNATLLIDPVPNRLWGTYYGGNGSDTGYAVLSDSLGYVCLGGTTSSTTDIATIGAWDFVFGEQFDGILVKFSGSGFRIWGTYYGGSGSDNGHALATDKSGNLYFGGWTRSTTDISTSGSWDESYGGGFGSDAFFVKFSPSGTRIWGTYFGGYNSDEGISSIVVDVSGSVYIGGATSSTSEIASTGSSDDIYGGGDFDGFLAKFSSVGYRLWGVYFGGSGYDAVNNLAIDNSSNIFLCGSTNSAMDIATKGAWDTVYSGGNSDVFIAKYNSSGSKIWATYYGGYGNDNGYGIAVDITGNVFFAGHTNSSESIATADAWDKVLEVSQSSTQDVFLAKFSSNGVRIWGTYYGGSSSEFNANLVMDESGNAYLCGGTWSISDMVSISTWDSLYNTGNSDAFLAKFNSSGTRVWGTYYGGKDEDVHFGSAIDKQGNVYVCGRTNSLDDISSTSAWDVSYGGGNGDLFIVKFESTDSKISTPDITNVSFCNNQEFLLPLTISGEFYKPNIFTVELSDLNGSFLKPIVIGSINSTISGNINCRIPIGIPSGTQYRIRITSSNPPVISNDNGLDISIKYLPSPTITGEQSICLSSTPSTFTVNQIPGYSIEWVKPRLGSIVSYKLNAISIIWNTSGTDSVRVKIKDNLSGCERDTILRVMIMKSPEPLITGDARACENQSPKVYRVQKQSGRTYSWSKPKNGIIIGSSTSDSISVQWVNSGSDTLRMEERDNATNCTKDTSFIVSIAPLPDATISGSNQVRENEQGITYSVKNESGLNYVWSIVSGDATIAGKTGNSVTLNAGKPGTVILKVKITNQNGCMSESELAITVKSLTGIRESSSAPFTLYPNPAGDHLYVKMDAEITGDINIELYDVLGNRHFQQTYQTTEVIRIPVQSLSQGMYMIKVKTSQDEYTERFVK